jgi:serine phosphatase RsbU (regulator of sigma subunit)
VKDKDLQIEKRRGQVKYLAAIAIILAAFGIWIVYALRNKHKANLIIQQQKKDVEFQKQLVDEKQKEIIDSINYAKRIQSTLLASKKFIDENIGKSFILFKPKDIVSGDFYWAASVFSAPMAIGTSFLAPEISNKQHSEAQLQNKGTGNQELLYIAVCDSTGHGVPGAFMSLLNIGFLSESIKERGIHSPDKVFNQVRQRLTESISSEGQRDGFDGMLLRLDKSARQVFYAAANNAPLLISGGAIKNLPYDKMHVGKGVSEEEFTLHSFSYSPGDMLYLFTDGYPDQFGGPKGKKFKYKQLEELVFKNHNEPIEAQHSRLAEAFESWRGNLEQVDDVCIIGIKL